MKSVSFIFAVGFLLTASAVGDVPVVSTDEGRVSGIVEETTNGNSFYSYYAIPYAKPPLGDLRFKDPSPALPWEGVRDGSSMPFPCPQVNFYLGGLDMKIPPEQVYGQEDCLYLNVFTPKDAPLRGKYSVMVYIHGGAFFAGGANEYLPHVLLNEDIVLVVMQYRLGFLGFLSTGDQVMPGNFGLKDQTLALEWVQKNIEHFGGDPKSVTIFGESAGGASVHYQMLTPKSKGLFRGAIMQSGNGLDPWALRDDHKEAAARVGSHLGCNLENGSQSFLHCMQSIDASNIAVASQHAQEWFLVPLYAVPRVDGVYLPDHPARLMKEGRYNKVNIITGITADEGGLMTLAMYSEGSNLISRLENNYQTLAPIILGFSSDDVEERRYTDMMFNYFLEGLHVSSQRGDDVTKMLGDHHMSHGNDMVSYLHDKVGGGVCVFRYELTHRGEMSLGNFAPTMVGRHYVTHGDDLFYLFRGGPMLNPPFIPNVQKDLKTTEDLDLRRKMLKLWTNFAKHGNPTPDASLGFQWEPSTADNLNYLDLKPSPSMQSDKRKEIRRFLLSLPTQMNLILNPDLISENQSKSGSLRHDEL